MKTDVMSDSNFFSLFNLKRLLELEVRSPQYTFAYNSNSIAIF